MSEKKKIHLSLAFIGNVGIGKSTTAGHFVSRCGGVSLASLEEIEKTSVEAGKPSLKYAWIFDKLAIERARSMTVDISHFYIETNSRKFSIIDTPGHKKYFKNTITGIAQADCAILVVSAKYEQFQEGISTNGLTRYNAIAALTMGIREVIVCCNKMDDKAVSYNEASFKKVKQNMTEFLTKVGFKHENTRIIPISGYFGDNLVERSPNLTWYDGPTLLEAIEKINPPKQATDKPLRIPVQRVTKIGGIGVIMLGRVESGILKQEMDIYFSPAQIKTSLRTIEMYHEMLSKAYPGDIVGFNNRGVGYRDVKKGDVCGDRKNDPPRQAVSFIGQVIIINHPGKIKKGYTPVIHCHTASVACKFVQIKAKIDRRTGKVIQQNPQFFVKGDCALVLMEPIKPMVCEAFSEYPKLGRFIVRDINPIVAVGIIKEVTKDMDNPKYI